MNRALTRTEFALLEALHAERTLNRQRTVAHGVVLHEMSNALTGLLGALEIFELRWAAGSGVAEPLDEMRRGARHVRETLEGLRILSADRNEAPRIVTGSLPDFLGEIVENCPGAAGRVKIERRGVAHLRYCPSLVRHVVTNLLRNALRYGDGTAPIRLLLTRDRAGRPWLHVLNRGPRIAPEIVERLFEPGRKHPLGGMGLGLHIVRTCVDRMGGELCFGTTAGATVFSVRLGETAAAPAPVPAAKEPAAVSPVPTRVGDGADQTLGACCGA